VVNKIGTLDAAERKVHIGYYYKAHPEAVARVLSQPVVGPGEEDGRSAFQWVRLADGTLILGVFPEGVGYEDAALDFAGDEELAVLDNTWRDLVVYEDELRFEEQENQ